MADLQRNSIPTPCLMVPFWIEHALLRKGKPLDVLFNYAEIKSIFSMEDLVALATINEDDTLPLAEIVPTESRLTQQWKASAEKPSGLLDRTITLATGLADTRRRLSTVDGVVDPATVLKIVHSPTSNIVYGSGGT